MQWLTQRVQPRPLVRPRVVDGFFQLPAWKRSVSAILYCLLCLEHWLSPSGIYREWIRVNLLVALCIGVAVLLTGPVVSALLINLREWTGLSIGILSDLISMVSVLPPIALVVVTGIVLWKLLKRHRPRRNTQHPGYYE